jgi:hypothetical protein
MDDVADVADAMGAVTIENGVNGKLVLPDAVEEHGEHHDAQANRDHSGESEVINPHEEAGGEASSHPEGKKTRPSKVILRQRCFFCVSGNNTVLIGVFYVMCL